MQNAGNCPGALRLEMVLIGQISQESTSLLSLIKLSNDSNNSMSHSAESHSDIIQLE